MLQIFQAFLLSASLLLYLSHIPLLFAADRDQALSFSPHWRAPPPQEKRGSDPPDTGALYATEIREIREIRKTKSLPPKHLTGPRVLADYGSLDKLLKSPTAPPLHFLTVAEFFGYDKNPHRYAMGEKVYTQLLRREQLPPHIKARVQRGLAEIAMEEGAFGEAEWRLRRAIADDPTYANPPVTLACLLSCYGDKPEEVILLSKQVLKQPKASFEDKCRAYLCLGVSLPPPESDMAFRNALLLAMHTKDPHMEFRAWLGLAVGGSEFHNLTQALNCAKRAGDVYLCGQALFRLATCPRGAPERREEYRCRLEEILKGHPNILLPEDIELLYPPEGP